MKTCSKCKVPKPLSEFNRNASKVDGVNTFCRECHNAHSKDYYAAHRTKMREQISVTNRRSWDKRRVQMLEYLKDKWCTDCGITDIRVLEFDHLPQHGKTANVSSMLGGGWSWKRILEEIAKCEIVCANCHRIRTIERGGAYRSTLASEAQLAEQQTLTLYRAGSSPV